MWNEQAAMQWARRWHYPQLCLPCGVRIYAGEQAWRHFLREATDEALDAIHRRVVRWNARASGYMPILAGEHP